MMVPSLLCAPVFLAAAALVPAGDPADAPPTRFADPVPLTAGGAPLEGLVYPSPALMDLDGDGREELVLGDLWGHLWSASPLKSGDVTAFGERAQVQCGPEPLKLNNW
ncbi:MAG: hypothetical protein AAFP86_11650 [Planctomycetota bacterium]